MSVVLAHEPINSVSMLVSLSTERLNPNTVAKQPELLILQCKKKITIHWVARDPVPQMTPLDTHIHAYAHTRRQTDRQTDRRQ